MVASQHDLLERINSAMKAMTVGDFGDSLLTEEASAQFIRVLADSTPLLQDARLITMRSHTRNIDRMEYEQGILRAPADAADTSNPSPKQNQLVATKVRGKVGIEDDALEDNIERAAFENTLLDMIANQAGFDLENLYLNGDTDGPTTDVTERLLAQIDGWLKLAGNNVVGDADPGAGEFNQGDVRAAFEAALQAIPKKYIRDRQNWRFGVHWDMENAFRDDYIDRNTTLGDTALSGDGELRYKGIRVKVVPNMPEGSGLLYRLGNPVYGVYRDVRIEPDRVPSEEKTDFIISARVDAHYENEEAAVAITGWTG